MSIRAALLTTLCALALVGCGGDGEEAAPAWNHDPSDAELGPEAWGRIDPSFETCRTGLEQSPVDVADAALADLPDLEFDYPEAPLVVENTGHTIEVPMREDGGQTLTVEGTAYRLVQFHFHAPSEHTLDGRLFAAEAHLVHESDDGRLVVVAVFIEPGSGAGPPLVDVVLGSAPAEAGGEVELEGESSPLQLLLVADSTKAVGSEYHTYEGSLTTPGCAEGVRWFVVTGAYPTQQSSIDRLHELVGGFPGYAGYENNNRPTQPLGDRVVERSVG